MARIPEHIIENVRQVADIYDVVSEYVNLKKRGRNFFGLCPFHNEKTPSFSLNIDKQIYKCFGCGKGGGTINFIMDMQKLDFVDAVKYLGQKYNIEIEISHNSKSNKDLFNQLYAMHEITIKAYQNNINDEVIKLLENRHISKKSIELFEIGLSFKKSDQLLQSMRDQQYSAEALKKSGLFIEYEKGYMDRFRNRIIFPIYNKFNKPIAFGGRIYNNETKTAKYLNSSETPIYNKSNTLYGLHITKNEILENKAAIVVEGYLDLIQLYQGDIKNVVSVSGTSFTNQHANEISKLCKTIYIAYDGDEAGISASIRAGYTIIKNNLEGKIIHTPHGLDPDDWIQQQGSAPFREAMKNADTIIGFHYKNIINKDSTERDKINFINDVIVELGEINDDLSLEVLVKELAYLTKFKIDSILNSIQNKKYKKYKKIEKKEIQNKDESVIGLLDKEIIMFCFSEKHDVRSLIKKYLNADWIQSEIIQNIYHEIYMHLSSENVVKPEIVMNELKVDTERNLMAELIFNKIEVNKNMVIDCLIRMEKNNIQTNLNKLRHELQENESNQIRLDEILEQINTLQKEKNNLKNKYTNV
tara:strand:- start:1584 stop:3341 length:1758 start_codon:yes stop_codon:yes gene_type:complete